MSNRSLRRIGSPALPIERPYPDRLDSRGLPDRHFDFPYQDRPTLGSQPGRPVGMSDWVTISLFDHRKSIWLDAMCSQICRNLAGTTYI